MKKQIKNYEERKNVCTECKAFCCKLGGAEFTKEEKNKVLQAGFPDNFIKINEEHYEVKTDGKGGCSYLTKNNLCSIDELKPKMCKAWPVFLDYVNGKKKFILMQCPLTKHLSDEQIEIMKKQIEGYNAEFIDCEETTLPDEEVDLIMKKYNSLKQKELK